MHNLQRLALTTALAVWATVWAVVSLGILRGPQIFNPHSVDWLLYGDPGQSFIGWMAYLNSPWQFPLGLTMQEAIPVQTSLVFTDSIPLIAIPAKLILTATQQEGLFQWFGFWSVFCVAASFVLSWQILKLLSVPPLGRLPGAMLLSLNPCVLLRSDHLALQGHWIVLWCFYAILKEHYRPRSKPSWVCVEFSLILFCATMVHPYLAAIAWIVLSTTLFQLARHKNLQAKVASTCGAAMSLVFLGAMWLTGYFVDVDLSDVPTEFYAADGLALFNPFHTSGFIPKLRATQQSLEGFAYPGVAILAVLAFFIHRGGHTIFKEFTPLFAGCAITLLLSLSPHWHLAGNRFISFDALFSLFEPIWLTFRSTGRFVWPTYYLVLLSALVIPFRYLKKKHAIFLVWAMAILQAAEFSGWLVDSRTKDAANTQKQAALREALKTQYESHASKGHLPTHVRLIPPYIPFQEKSCTPDPALSERVFFAAASVALSKRVPINSGVFARFKAESALEHCAEQTAAWRQGVFDPKAFYVVETGLASSGTAPSGFNADCFAHEFAPYCLATKYFGASN